MSRGTSRPADSGLEEQRRKQLVAAVVKCIAEEGFERTTTRNIADRAGVSIGMLNYYFKTKKELVVQAIRVANEGVQRALAQTDSIPFGPRRLRFILQRTVRNEYPQALPLAFRLAVTAAAVNDPDLRVEVCRWMEDGRSKFERSIEAGMSNGTYRSDLDARLASVMLYGAMAGLTHEAAVCPERMSVDLAVEAMLMLLGLFEAKPRESQVGSRGAMGCAASLPDSLESLLLADSNLSGSDALALGAAFRAMYEVFTAATARKRAVNRSESRA
jgi:AcrR family transcriptional regulator